MSLGVIGGFLAGFALWSRQQRADRRHLFSANPVRRLAALGYLRTQEDDQTVTLLREYLAWETKPELRRRARRILRRMEQSLDRSIERSAEGAASRAAALAAERSGVRTDAPAQHRSIA